MPTALLLTVLAPGLLLVSAALLGGLLRVLLPGTLPPAALTRLPTLPGLPLSRLSLSGLSTLPRLLPTRPVLPGLRLSRLLTWLLARLLLTGLAPAATLLRLLRPLAPTTLARLLLSPAALTLSPLLPARLAPRLPRTPRSLWRRRHIHSLETHE